MTEFNGNVEQAVMRYIIRDFDPVTFVEKQEKLRQAVAQINETYGEGTAEVKIEESYRNMREKIEPHMAIVEAAQQAMRDVSKGLSPTMRAGKVQQKAARAGYVFPEAEDALQAVRNAAVKVGETMNRKRDPEKALGEMLFDAVNVTRLCGKSADIALNEATDRFIDRFSTAETATNAAKNAPNT